MHAAGSIVTKASYLDPNTVCKVSHLIRPTCSHHTTSSLVLFTYMHRLTHRVSHSPPLISIPYYSSRYSPTPRAYPIFSWRYLTIVGHALVRFFYTYNNFDPIIRLIVFDTCFRHMQSVRARVVYLSKARRDAHACPLKTGLLIVSTQKLRPATF